jgi:hypothetical protein
MLAHFAENAESYAMSLEEASGSTLTAFVSEFLDMEATHLSNRSLNRSSRRDHVSYSKIPPPAAYPPAPALSATPDGDLPHHTLYNPLQYRTQTGRSH